MKNTDRTQIHIRVKDWKKKSHKSFVLHQSADHTLYFTIKIADYYWKVISVIHFIAYKCCFTCWVSCCWMWKTSWRVAREVVGILCEGLHKLMCRQNSYRNLDFVAFSHCVNDLRDKESWVIHSFIHPLSYFLCHNFICLIYVTVSVDVIYTWQVVLCKN